MKLRNYIIFCFAILCLANCNNSYSINSSAPLIEPPHILNYTNAYDDTARFLAGQTLEKEQYKSLTENKQYEHYKTTVNEIWNAAFGPNMEKVGIWRKNNLNNDYSKAIFYPFSGPDIVLPLKLYPNANEIVMFGLEPTGGIPDITKVDKANINNHLQQFIRAIDSALNQAFFITKDMKVQITHSSLNGVSAIMMFFLAKNDYNIVQVKEINITSNGSVTSEVLQSAEDSVKGIEILFTEKNSKNIKRVRYFSLDVNNTSLQVNTFGNYMQQYPLCSTIFKSASYLVWWGNFTKIRDIILKQSESILQDDTGIPYKVLKESGSWDITHFGKYHEPIPRFRPACYQKLLDEDNRLYSKGALPFIYGYGWGVQDMTYHLVWARRIKK